MWEKQRRRRRRWVGFLRYTLPSSFSITLYVSSSLFVPSHTLSKSFFSPLSLSLPLSLSFSKSSFHLALSYSPPLSLSFSLSLLLLSLLPTYVAHSLSFFSSLVISLSLPFCLLSLFFLFLWFALLYMITTHLLLLLTHVHSGDDLYGLKLQGFNPLRIIKKTKRFNFDSIVPKWR